MSLGTETRSEVPAATTKLGFIGLRRMGGHLAERLLSTGYTVYSDEASRAQARGALDRRLRWCDSPRHVAQIADVIFTSVRDDEALEEVAFGEGGVLAGLTPGKTWVETSTVSPEINRQLARLAADGGVDVSDAPAWGSAAQVRTGSLTIMVGGAPKAYFDAEPLLRALGRPYRVGGNGLGLALHLAINISLAVQMLAFSEGLLLAERAGVDRRRALEVMASSPIVSPLIQARAPFIADPPEEPWLDLTTMHEDIELALSLARRMALRLPSAKCVNEVLARARTLGYGKRDLTQLFQVIEEIAADHRPHSH